MENIEEKVKKLVFDTISDYKNIRSIDCSFKSAYYNLPNNYTLNIFKWNKKYRISVSSKEKHLEIIYSIEFSDIEKIKFEYLYNQAFEYLSNKMLSEIANPIVKNFQQELESDILSDLISNDTDNA